MKLLAIERDNQDAIDPKTKNFHFGVIKELFSWAEDQQYPL